MAETPELTDLQEIRALLRSLLRELEGVNKRLDKVNGRIDRNEDHLAAALIALAEAKVKISNLNHEVFERGDHHQGDATTVALVKDIQALVQSATSGDNRPAFTIGDVNVVTKIGKLAWALMGLLGGAGLLYWAQQVVK